MLDITRELRALHGSVTTVHVRSVHAAPVISHRHALAMQDALVKLNRQGAGKQR